jgi:predicted phage terminase large subunit-like protein
MAAVSPHVNQDLLALRAAKRILRAKKARESLIDFACMTMPDPKDPDNVDLSRYKPARHHRALAAALEEIAFGRWKRLIIAMPPRHGKSELASRRFLAWFIGLFPHLSTVFATYGEDLANDFGRKVRDIMESDAYRQIFPEVQLKDGAKAADRLETTYDGLMIFAGRGSTITGRGGNLLVLDDPIKDRVEANSKLIRDQLWEWFSDVFMSRLMDDEGRVIIIQTRWHEDDLVGRLTDPRNACYNEAVASEWRILNLAALALPDDPMGREPGEALWPERFSAKFLEAQRALNPRNFSALYQGKPTPDDGAFFKREHIVGYGRMADIPDNLIFYAASDHAVSTKQDRDATCLLPVGVDQYGDIWVLPEVYWKRKEATEVVEAMLDIMKRRKPIFWWAENGHITKSIGPFLRQRMRETGIYCSVDAMTPTTDKMSRAQSIQGRMAMGKVHFPTFAPWYSDAVDELLKFPNGAHDDFVDALAYIGLGLDRIAPAQTLRPKNPFGNEPRPGTIAWIKWAAQVEEQERRELLESGGY